MKISVLIPAFNAAATLAEALDSVLAQTAQPSEIVLVDDGSSDATRAIAARYRSSLRYILQKNAGIAATRNRLCRMAKGDVFAFLDADDVWHPRYLECQASSFASFPNTLVSFTGHTDFSSSPILWPEELADRACIQRFDLLSFLREYHARPGRFANQSHCCLARRAFERLGPHPYRLRRAEDLYFFTRLPLYCEGDIVFTPISLAAYRLRQDSLSANRVLLNQAEVLALQLLQDEYRAHAGPRLWSHYRLALAGKRRQYAKALLGARRRADGRRELSAALNTGSDPAARAKAACLLLATYLPELLQPDWPAAKRT